MLNFKFKVTMHKKYNPVITELKSRKSVLYTVRMEEYLRAATSSDPSDCTRIDLPLKLWCLVLHVLFALVPHNGEISRFPQ